MLRAMGFPTVATIAATAAAVVPKIFEAKASFEQSEDQSQAADEQQYLANQQAEAYEETASANQRRGSRNAIAELAKNRVDAAASNTAQEGSTYLRGVDLATRLQDEIDANANELLTRANTIRRQGAYDAWDLRNQAKQSYTSGVGSAVSGVGSLFSSIATGLAGSAAAGGSSQS